MDKALLVGINDYPGAPLKGCVNDVSMMADLLVSRYGFKEEDTRLLVDRRATTKRILGALEWLVDMDAPGRCVFHYSGHGVQVATRNFRQEVDGLDEVLCPVDFNWADPYMIRDKQLYKTFRKIPKGIKFAWVSDSCHSGDLIRDMPKNVEVPRTMPLPPDVAWDVRIAKKKQLCCIGMNPANDVMDVHVRSVTQGQLDVGFVSGCRSDQTSADTVIHGIPCGALTWHLIKYLKKMPKKTPLEKVVAAARSELAKKGYSQRPTADGTRKNKPFLG